MVPRNWPLGSSLSMSQTLNIVLLCMGMGQGLGKPNNVRPANACHDVCRTVNSLGIVRRRRIHCKVRCKLPRISGQIWRNRGQPHKFLKKKGGITLFNSDSPLQWFQRGVGFGIQDPILLNTLPQLTLNMEKTTESGNCSDLHPRASEAPSFAPSFASKLAEASRLSASSQGQRWPCSREDRPQPGPATGCDWMRLGNCVVCQTSPKWVTKDHQVHCSVPEALCVTFHAFKSKSLPCFEGVSRSRR